MKQYELQKVGLEFVDTAPARLINTVHVKATPEQIWSALEDATAWPRWAKAIKRVEWTSERPFGVGTTRTVTMSGRMTVFERFIAWEPHRLLAFRFDRASMNGVSAFAESYTIEPRADGTTSVTWVMAMAPAGPSRAIVPLTRPLMRALFGRWLRNFGRLVEREYATAPTS